MIRIVVEATFADAGDADRAKAAAEDAVWRHNGEIDTAELHEDDFMERAMAPWFDKSWLSC